MKRVALPAVCLLCWTSLCALASDAPTGLQEGITFQEYTPLSASTELLRRLVTPLNAQKLLAQARHTGAAIREQPVDLAQEHFALYVPTQAPPSGYALLVFVPPWNEARVPPSWMTTLEKRGVILVTPGNAGNDANVLDRRDPLALLAAANVMSRYRVDPQRVYIGGFSGGSRVALRLALGYPDLFHGALLDAGSDMLGDQIPLPPADLLQQFQASTRIVYLTGERDPSRLDADRQSRQSMKTWCITDIDVRTTPWTAHALADASALERALQSLDQHDASDASKLASCRARIDKELNEKLDAVDEAMARGDREHVRKQLDAIDARFGGLAAPRSVALMQRLDAAPSK